MFNKLLIANRGEIACRIIKTAARLGIRTVAVYSDADSRAQHVKLADEAYHIGPAPALESYLVVDRIIEVALACGADAIHPGYGFLSENATFCAACEANNITFVGPSASAMVAMGDKAEAKKLMEASGVPCTPGYHGEDQSLKRLSAAAHEIGFPVILKAAAGGGGKGMRIVEQEADFADALGAAQREAQNAFGDDVMLIEKYLAKPRHVEVQVFCDRHGGGVYLGDRDCSLQRRHQKVIEEAPAPGLSDDCRREMGETAVRAAHAIDYCGAGTIEFLLNDDGKFYFMEMNTRLQVEHPVTESVTGLDLVEWQLRIAAGEKLPLEQQAVTLKGHSVEARIYAEDSDNDFLPDSGRLLYYCEPRGEHLRVDSGVVAGDQVSAYYDPMIAKLIATANSREAAIDLLAEGLKNFRIEGLRTNLAFLYNLTQLGDFRGAELCTSLINQNYASLTKVTGEERLLFLAAAAVWLHPLIQQDMPGTGETSQPSPWSTNDGWRMNHEVGIAYALQLDGELYQCLVSGGEACPFSHADNTRVERRFQLSIDDQNLSLSANISGDALQLHYRDSDYELSVVPALSCPQLRVFCAGKAMTVQLPERDPKPHSVGNTDHKILAPMNGTLVSLLVEAGQSVTQGTALAVMEAMKMEHTIKAPCDGTLEEFFHQPGDRLNGGAEIAEFLPAGEE